MLLGSCGASGGSNLFDFDGDGVLDQDDCVPDDPAVYPGSEDPVDASGVDNNCDGVDGVDQDQDGHASLDGEGLVVDCNDNNSAIYPGAVEICDQADNDCDGLTDDESSADAASWHPDADGDGAGDPAQSVVACVVPPGYVADSSDCDDRDASVLPGAVELCDGLDTDCDGALGSGLDGTPDEADGDGDGVVACLDCDDANPSRFPGAVELCDGLDNDCNELADFEEGEDDIDGDGAPSCSDCNDGDVANTPGAVELCDGQDNDCNGLADFEGGEDDLDGDGVAVCAGDCDDADPANWVGAVELCDGQDNDCNGLADADAAGEQDTDGDGALSCLDCDDSSAANRPGGVELCDGLDNDCDDGTFADALGEIDGDGDGSFSCADCNDADVANTPGASEVCDGQDNDCNGLADADGGELDADQDGVLTCGGDCDDADPANAPGNLEQCDGQDNDCDDDTSADAAGEVDDDGDGALSCVDCDDSDASNTPGAAELCDGEDNDCNGLADAEDGEEDGDGDGMMGCAGDCDDADSANFLGGNEACDGQDNDCDGGPGSYETDADEDGHMPCEGDCNDESATMGANFPELCDGLDNDCDGLVPDQELDGDSDEVMACDGDCDDANFHVRPDAAELCDGLDTDCDPTTWADAGQEQDLDGDGDPSCSDCDDSDGTVETLDVDGDGVSSCALDCDDGTLGLYTYPGAADLHGDTIDQNCDGIDGIDDDGDGWPDNATPTHPDWDCDPDDPSVHPNPDSLDLIDVEEIDSNCDGIDGVDSDGDGWASGDSGGEDCDDDDPLINLSVFDPWDELDANCDGSQGVDADGDGYAQNAPGSEQDCNDVDPDVYPGSNLGWETPNVDGDINCDGILGTSLALIEPLFVGEVELDDSGQSAVAAGDVNGDGLGDLLIGSPDHSEYQIEGGKAYLVLGREDGAAWSEDLGDAHAIFIGDDVAYGQVGYSVSSAGDVDGDGLSDVLIGAPGDDDAFPATAGSAYLLFGSALGAGGVFPLSEAAVTILGEELYDYFGNSVAGAGDVDGDGLADLLIGAPGSDADEDQAGRSYLFLGSSVMAWLSAGPSAPLDASDADLVISGSDEYSESGWAVDGAGDVDGDGLADVLIGAPADYVDDEYGKAYLILGATSMPRLGGGMSLSEADVALIGQQGATAGNSLATAGDVNGDGLSDILIGAEEDATAHHRGGATYLVFGRTTGFPADYDLLSADVVLLGENMFDYSGTSVSSAGDVDGDGLDDVVIGANGNDDVGSRTGKTYLFYGSDLLAGGTFSLSEAGAAFVGEGHYDRSGTSVATAGDVNGDGLSAMLIGADQDDSDLPDSNPGRTYLVHSPFEPPAYAGLWRLSPFVNYTCDSGSVGVVVEQLHATYRPTYAAIDPAVIAGAYELTMASHTAHPGTLEGGFVSPDVFLVERTRLVNHGACTATWSLAGSFTGADALAGDVSIQFTGDCSDCVDGSWSVTASR